MNRQICITIDENTTEEEVIERILEKYHAAQDWTAQVSIDVRLDVAIEKQNGAVSWDVEDRDLVSWEVDEVRPYGAAGPHPDDNDEISDAVQRLFIEEL